MRPFYICRMSFRPFVTDLPIVRISIMPLTVSPPATCRGGSVCFVRIVRSAIWHQRVI